MSRSARQDSTAVYIRKAASSDGGDCAPALDVGGLRGLDWEGEIFPLGGWGGGVFNGGAWLTVEGRRVDVHYRDLNDVQRRVCEAERGDFEIEHLAFYLAGIPTYFVVAELALGRILSGELPRPAYPEALKGSASARWQERAEMTLHYATRAYAERGDVIGSVGSATRALLEAAHARLAAGGIWITKREDARRAGRSCGHRPALHRTRAR